MYDDKEALVSPLDITYPQVFDQKGVYDSVENVIAMANKYQAYYQRHYYTLPFDHMLEFNKFRRQIDNSQVLLEAVSQLQGSIVFNVTSPLTVFYEVVKPKAFRQMMKQPFPQEYIEWWQFLLRELDQRQVAVISYADPTFVVELVGPKRFKNQYAPVNLAVLQAFLKGDFQACLHLHAKLLEGLEACDLIAEKECFRFEGDLVTELLKHRGQIVCQSHINELTIIKRVVIE